MTDISGGVDSITGTTARLIFGNRANNGSIDIQVSPRADFSFCVAPVYNVTNTATQVVRGLNAGSVYYVRARARLNNGTVDDWSLPAAFMTLAGGARDTSPAAVMIEPASLVLPAPIVSAGAANIVAGFPIENLFRDSPTAMRKTQDAANEHYFDVQIGGQPIDTVALLNTNLPEAATWYLQASQVPIVTVDDIKYSSPIIPFRASPNLPQRAGFHGLMRLAAPQSYPFWRIRISGAPLTANMLHAEHFIIGLNRVSRNHAVEKTETPTPQTTVERKRSGVPDRVSGYPMRKAEFELANLTEAQYETLYGELWRRENDAALVVPNSKAGAFLHDRILYGDLTAGRAVNTTSPRYTRQFGINSVI